MLTKIVESLLEEHKGGEVFFDHLDASVRNSVMINTLADSFKQRKNIIVSGRFGKTFEEVMKDSIENLLVVDGDLRKGNTLNLDHLADSIRGKWFTFVDDSYYSGTTRKVIRNELNRLGGCLGYTYVIYDGSPCRDFTVFGLYSYYNKFGRCGYGREI